MDGLKVLGLEPLVLQGGMGKKARGLVMDELATVRPGGGVILIATGSFLGEGFDCPPLDTLFLAFPIAFKGRIVQYVGRVLRPIDGKRRVEVHDYVDVRVPVLARMHTRRLPAYATLGFDARHHPVDIAVIGSYIVIVSPPEPITWAVPLASIMIGEPLATTLSDACMPFRRSPS